jgi:hypothetical protein
MSASCHEGGLMFGWCWSSGLLSALPIITAEDLALEQAGRAAGAAGLQRPAHLMGEGEGGGGGGV